MTHSINLTHDGTLILRIPKGYKVDKVVVEEMGTDNRKEYVPDTNVGELVNKSGDLVKGLVNNEVPSVQPTHPIPSKALGALDCVDRQAAIDTVKFGITYAKVFNKFTGEAKELFKEGNKALNEAAERLKELPPVQPRRGKWIKGRDGIYHCSCCGTEYLMYDAVVQDTHYCPNCGSYNGGEQTG